MTKTPEEVAIELGAKFEFYLLALAFAVLGLSIQTAEFGTNLAADILELAGWLALFLSGVIGILRGELIPLAYQIESNIASNSRRQSEILEAFQRGIQIQITFVEDGAERSLTGERAAEKLGQVVSTLEERWSTANTKIGRRYVAMKIAFMVGIGCLLVARGMPPALSVAERLASWWALAPP